MRTFVFTCRPTNSEENTCFHVRIYQVCRNRPIKILEYYDRPRPESPFRVNSAYYQLRRHNILTESEKRIRSCPNLDFTTFKTTASESTKYFEAMMIYFSKDKNGDVYSFMARPTKNENTGKWEGNRFRKESVDIVASCLTEWDDEKSAVLMDSRSQKSAASKVVRTWVLSFMYGCVFGAIVTLLLI